MSGAISPLLSSRLNNIANSNTVNSNSQINTAPKPNINDSDTFFKRNKKKIIIGSVIGAAIAAVGFVLLAKTGKLGSKCQEFVNNIFHFKQKPAPQVPTNKTPDVQIPDKQPPTDVTKNSDESKIITQIVDTTQQKADKAVFDHAQNLGNGKIRVFFKKGEQMQTPFELPEYLYHITSDTAMKSIVSDGALKTSQHEQLRGVYLLDSENFLQNYSQTTVNEQRRDLFSAIFRQANKGNKGVDVSAQEQYIIRIPTQDLLASGKLRVRTQEDFFKYNDMITDLSKKIGKKFNLRRLCDDAARAEFRSLVISKNLMTEAEIDSFLAEMTKRIHRGYSIESASALSGNCSVEYIFNNDIEFSKFPNIAMQKFRLSDFAVPSSNNRKFLPSGNIQALFSNQSAYRGIADI